MDGVCGVVVPGKLVGPSGGGVPVLPCQAVLEALALRGNLPDAARHPGALAHPGGQAAHEAIVRGRVLLQIGHHAVVLSGEHARLHQPAPCGLGRVPGELRLIAGRELRCRQGEARQAVLQGGRTLLLGQGLQHRQRFLILAKLVSRAGLPQRVGAVLDQLQCRFPGAQAVGDADVEGAACAGEGCQKLPSQFGIDGLRQEQELHATQAGELLLLSRGGGGVDGGQQEREGLGMTGKGVPEGLPGGALVGGRQQRGELPEHGQPRRRGAGVLGEPTGGLLRTCRGGEAPQRGERLFEEAPSPPRLGKGAHQHQRGLLGHRRGGTGEGRPDGVGVHRRPGDGGPERGQALAPFPGVGRRGRFTGGQEGE